MFEEVNGPSHDQFKISYESAVRFQAGHEEYVWIQIDPKLEIAEHIIVRHHWITKVVRSEVPFRTPCSLPSVVLSG